MTAMNGLYFLNLKYFQSQLDNYFDPDLISKAKDPE